MKDHSELERAIERAAKRHRENALVNEHLDELAKLWKERVALRGMLPTPDPWQRPDHFRDGKVSDQFLWLN